MPGPAGSTRAGSAPPHGRVPQGAAQHSTVQHSVTPRWRHGGAHLQQAPYVELHHQNHGWTGVW